MAYEGVDLAYEYLDLSRRNFGIAGLLEVLEDIAEDNIIKQLDLGYNMTPDDVSDHRDVEYFFKRLKFNLAKNTTLTALDLAGNHLFDHFPHPSNEHTKNYVEELSDILSGSTLITHIDLSENNITGNSNRELKGLRTLMGDYMVHGKAFVCKFSRLNSQCLQVVSTCLGPYSNMTYLDLSDNMGGLDPRGQKTSEGVQAIALCMGHSLHMRVLKMARNFLRDEHIACIADVLHNMPQFQDLDLSGNYCHQTGAKALKLAIISHSVLSDPGQGFREINLSNNPLGDEGVRELCLAIEKTETIKVLHLAFCDLKDVSMVRIQRALVVNSSIVSIDVGHNEVSEEVEIRANAEIEANHLINLLRIHHDSVNTEDLSNIVYDAVSRKLHCLDKEQLMNLHSNPSFNVDMSPMKYALHMIQPPPRHRLIDLAKDTDHGLEDRLVVSRLLDVRLHASRIIYNCVMRWYKDIRIKNAVAALLAEAKRKEEERNARNDEDDRFNKY